MLKQRSNFLFKIIIFILAMFCVAGILCIQPLKNAATDSKYVMNNASCTYNGDSEQTLYGNWEFYYNQLLVTDNVKMPKSDGYINVPDKWKVASNGKYSSGGKASYKASIEGIPAGTEISIGFDNMSVSYAIYVNGSKIGGSGTFEKINDEDYKATVVSGDQVDYSLYKVTSDEPLEIIIEVVANSNGGLYKCPILFIGDAIEVFIYSKIIQKSIIVGFLLLAFIMHIFRLTIAEKGKRNPIPLIFIGSLLLLSFFSGSLFAYFVSKFDTLKAAYGEITDDAVAVLSICITALACMGLFDKAHHKSSIIGCVLVGLSYLIMIIYQLFESQPFFSNDLVYSIVLGIRPILMIMAILFFFAKEEKTSVSLLTKMSFIFLCFVDFLKSLNSSGLYYDTTKTTEFVCCLLAIVFSLLSYFKGIKQTNKILLENDKLTEDNTQFKINLLLNQIKPHFLYNTLNSINSLCKIDPSAASNAIVSFSNYLRNNMESISDSNMIPVSKELEHVKCYVDIEQIRFRERLKIKYDIKAYNFLVPPLSMQAIVENAIKHGVSSMVEGVTITIKTYEDKDYCYAVIQDNGVGFDINSIIETDSVGLSNICRRIEMLCKGQLILKSRVGKGTTITLKLKK